MADMTPTPWPSPDADHHTDRLWPNGSFAAWAFDDGSWSVFHPSPALAGRMGKVYAENETSCISSSPALLEAARTAADEALARLLAEMAAEVSDG